ncbi:DUF898 domain-containing protein [Sinisalibacter lacisalsi]|uniref:Membrane protein n=1 Tax=Sinisalibacter lacisalsi TaxID=1526570 RepID=A0ABQ1QDL5_9RHOB|nr:DUF898 domain-containing protein [Sinisalibacter lacisalsi]GGD24116.1 membrane protein [Sinisalibacter lacisalsi]
MALRDLTTDYAGRGAPMFRLALKTGVLTVLTLGFYRFWMKTRMRRYYWSAIRPGGQPLEFTGRPTEMLMGFLTAVVVLAFYIGLVNLVLMFLSFSLFKGEAPAYLLSFLGLVPIIFFAQYRARRYILARTRWRGIRFGLEPGVKGYVWRATLWWIATILSAGILWPVKTFELEKYRTDRTFYGDARFEQTGGRWSLIGAMKHVYIAAALIGGGIFASTMSDEPVWLVATAMGAAWAVLGLGHWKAESFKRLTEGKRLGEVRFRCHPRGGRIVGIYLLGGLAIAALLFALLFALGMAIGVLLSFLDPELIAEGFDDFASLAALPAWLATLLGLVAYFSVFLFWGVLREVFITMPIARHLAETTEIVNPDALNAVRQRPRDEFAEAEGFADALPLGDGI